MERRELRAQLEEERVHLRAVLERPAWATRAVAETDGSARLSAARASHRDRRSARRRLQVLDANWDWIQHDGWGRCTTCGERMADELLLAEPARRRCPSCEVG